MTLKERLAKLRAKRQEAEEKDEEPESEPVKKKGKGKKAQRAVTETSNSENTKSHSFRVVLHAHPPIGRLEGVFTADDEQKARKAAFEKWQMSGTENLVEISQIS